MYAQTGLGSMGNMFLIVFCTFVALFPLIVLVGDLFAHSIVI